LKALNEQYEAALHVSRQKKRQRKNKRKDGESERVKNTGRRE